jgi:hypothetical protein
MSLRNIMLLSFAEVFGDFGYKAFAEPEPRHPLHRDLLGTSPLYIF